MSEHQNGKGSKPRPYSVNQETFASNWERVFGNKESKDDTCAYSGLPSPATFQDLQKDVTELAEKLDYMAELKSGMFFERYPTLTGNWENDKSEWLLLKLSKQSGENYATSERN